MKMATAAFAPLTGAVDNGKSYNVERVLRSNIVYSDYYRQLCKVTDFMTLVDEMYNEVTHVEPWMSGNARGPSTAFCILYRLFTLAPSVASEDEESETQMLDDTQIAHLLNHGDSPYIRAIGFLYLRYVCPHKKLITHLEPYFADDERFAPTADPRKETTVGAFVRDLVLDQHYFETIFPRIPEVARRELVRAIAERGFEQQPAGLGGVGGPSRRGDDGRARPQSVKAALSVDVGQRAPHVKRAAERGMFGTDPGSRARAYGEQGEQGEQGKAAAAMDGVLAGATTGLVAGAAATTTGARATGAGTGTAVGTTRTAGEAHASGVGAAAAAAAATGRAMTAGGAVQKRDARRRRREKWYEK